MIPKKRTCKSLLRNARLGDGEMVSEIWGIRKLELHCFCFVLTSTKYGLKDVYLENI